MFTIQTTPVFNAWFGAFKDMATKARIQLRIDRIVLGHFGDVAPVGENVSEMRLFFGAGYRIYFIQHGQQVVILLAGGDKSSQSKDI